VKRSFKWLGWGLLAVVCKGIWEKVVWCRDVMSVSLRVATLESIDILTGLKSLLCHIDAMDLGPRLTCSRVVSV
jgi:hypothetical protein